MTPTDGEELQASPLDVPIPGLSDFWPGVTSAVVLIEPAGRVTDFAPPPPNQPVKGSTGTISIARDPNGFKPTIVGFTGATLNDNALPVPGAHGCGLFDTADWIVNSLFGLPSAAGHNAITLSPVTTALAVDSSDSDLIDAINATRK